MSAVLVTGGSGFVGSHCILKLLAAGHTVRATVRHLEREADVRSMLKTGGADPGDRLSFFAANPESDAGWTDALAGCDYLLHVASPIPVAVPKNEDELIVPARQGALRVLRAARARPGAGRRQSRRSTGPGAGSGLLALDHDRAAPDGRLRSRLPATLVRRSGRARCR